MTLAEEMARLGERARAASRVVGSAAPAAKVAALEELARLLVDVAGQGEYVIREFPEERKKIDIGDYYSDASKIERELGWKPTTPLRDALADTLEYFRPCWQEYCACSNP